MLELLLHDDSFVNLLKESALCRVITGGIDSLHHSRSLLLDSHSNLLLLLLESLILIVVFSELVAVDSEDFLLLGLILVNLHKLLDQLKVVKHGITVVHDLLFLDTDLLELLEALLDTSHCRVLLNLASGGGLWDHGGDILAGLREKLEALLIGLVFG